MLNRLSIRYKIGLIALIGLLGFVIFQTASYRLSINLRDQMQKMISEDFVLLQFANEIQVDFSQLDKIYQASLIEADMDTLHEANAKANGMRLQFQTMQDLYDIDEHTFLELVRFFNAYVEKISTHTAAVLHNSLDYESTLAGYSDINVLRAKYQDAEKSFLQNRYSKFEKQLRSIEKQENFFVQFGLVLGIVLSVLLLASSIFIVRRLISTFNNAVSVADQIASGNLEQEIKTIAEDETGQLINSLIVMRNALKKQREENKKRVKEQNFLAGLNEVMRMDRSLENLAQEVLNYLIIELHAQMGTFYMLDNSQLVMVANQGYSKNDSIDYTIQLGDKLVGQVAVEQRIQVINEIPELYNQIFKNNDETPCSMLLFPVIYQHNLKGVIEVTSTRYFDNDDVSLARRCNNAIAVAINSAQSRFEVASMLRQTQEQAKKLNQQRLELFEKSQALELSGRYKTQFLSTMSHELRTPLNSILILSEALTANRKGHLDEAEIQHAKVINTAGSDLLSLINDILDLSKVEEGKMEVVVDEIVLSEFSYALQEQFEYIAKEKSLEYSVSIAQDVPEIFYTDRHRLKQIIKNFISNALKFTEEGGVYVEIERPDDILKLQYPHIDMENAVIFRVRDTGVGIDAKKQALIFEAFRQADGTTSRKYGGTGLGLSISLALAKLLGGDIVLQSAGVGMGASFTLILPVIDAPVFLEGDSGKPATYAEQRTRVDSADFSINDAMNAHVREELLLLIEKEDIAKNIIKSGARLHVDAHWEREVETFEVLIKKYHFSMALIDIDILSEDQLIALSTFSSHIDRVYVMASDAQKAFIESQGCFYVNKNVLENIKDFLVGLVDYQVSHSYNVLVVEDNPVFQEVLKSVFKSHQLRVSIASDGESALSLIHQDLFDCLIVDLNLPDYKGVELLKKIRNVEQYKTRPIIIFTAEDLTHERQKEIKLYASQILLKTPKVIVALYENVRHLILQHQHKLQLSSMQGLHNEGTYKSGDLANKTVLVVDDDERNIYSLVALLKAEEINVITAMSGMEALSILSSQPSIDIVLLDIMMPEMDGYEVLASIRSNKQLEDMPVIAVTAKVMTGDKEKCLAAGATAYLAKPVNKQGLLSIIVENIMHF
jgi:hypothetical protein